MFSSLDSLITYFSFSNFIVLLLSFGCFCSSLIIYFFKFVSILVDDDLLLVKPVSILLLTPPVLLIGIVFGIGITGSFWISNILDSYYFYLTDTDGFLAFLLSGFLSKLLGALTICSASFDFCSFYWQLLYEIVCVVWITSGLSWNCFGINTFPYSLLYSYISS